LRLRICYDPLVSYRRRTAEGVCVGFGWNNERKKSWTRRFESVFFTLWRELRCFVRGRPFVVGVGVLVDAAIAYTGGRVTSGVEFGEWVMSGVDDGTSAAIAVDTVDVSISTGQSSRLGCFVRICAAPKPIAPASEIIATAIADHATRRARL
jgi:hypothetical protein